jgi:hypothetical protein
MNASKTEFLKYEPVEEWAKETNKHLDGKISITAAERAKPLTAEQVNRLRMGKASQKDLCASTE